MSKIDAGGSAYPLKNELAGAGMTLLDWFAGQAMNNVEMYDPGFSGKYRNAEDVAIDCYDVAAAMIAEKRRREAGEGS